MDNFKQRLRELTCLVVFEKFLLINKYNYDPLSRSLNPKMPQTDVELIELLQREMLLQQVAGINYSSNNTAEQFLGYYKRLKLSFGQATRIREIISLTKIAADFSSYRINKIWGIDYKTITANMKYINNYEATCELTEDELIPLYAFIMTYVEATYPFIDILELDELFKKSV